MPFAARIRIVCMACCLAMTASCVQSVPPDPQPASKEEYAQYDTLVQLADLNEAAFKYVQFCEPSGTPIHPVFNKNYQYTLGRLMDETIKTQRSSPRMASLHILRRREALDAALTDTFQKDGCTSAVANKGQQQYRFFSDFTPAKIDLLVKQGLKAQI